MLDRDIRLSADQIVTARNACARRRQDLDRRLARTSYEGKPGMKTAVLKKRAELAELERILEHNRKQIAQQVADKLRTQIA